VIEQDAQGRELIAGDRMMNGRDGEHVGGGIRGLRQGWPLGKQSPHELQVAQKRGGEDVLAGTTA
jgi:hypothetical protein